MPKVEKDPNESSARKEGQPGRSSGREASMQNVSSRRDPNAMSQSSSSSRPKPPMKIANGKYEIQKRLGAGCFGEVYQGLNAETKQEVAVKFEDTNARTQQLEQEATMMGILRQPVQPQGFSECFYFGKEGRYHCMVMELLGKSLEDCVQICKGRFSPLSTALVGEQLICRLEYLHSKGIVHRDIKPENFMWGSAAQGKQHHLYMIDFGLSKRYFEKEHVRPREKLSLTGTARYASINAHKGLEQSRRDDLEAVGHMLLYFLRSVLPWSGLDAKTKEEKYRRIAKKKEDTPLDELCAGFPKEFKMYLEYARNLEFMDRPDYKMCRSLFQAVRADLGPSVEDHGFDWLKDQDIDPKKLVPLNPWVPPCQPDDVDAVASKAPRRSWGFCCGKPPRND